MYIHKHVYIIILINFIFRIFNTISLSKKNNKLLLLIYIYNNSYIYNDNYLRVLIIIINSMIIN
jgi:hypothetical protein